MSLKGSNALFIPSLAVYLVRMLHLYKHVDGIKNVANFDTYIRGFNQSIIFLFLFSISVLIIQSFFCKLKLSKTCINVVQLMETCIQIIFLFSCFNQFIFCLMLQMIYEVQTFLHILHFRGQLTAEIKWHFQITKSQKVYR